MKEKFDNPYEHPFREGEDKGDSFVILSKTSDSHQKFEIFQKRVKAECKGYGLTITCGIINPTSDESDFDKLTEQLDEQIEMLSEINSVY